MFAPDEATPEVLARIAKLAEQIDETVHGHLKREVLTALANVAVHVIRCGRDSDAWFREFNETMQVVYDTKNNPPAPDGN